MIIEHASFVAPEGKKRHAQSLREFLAPHLLRPQPLHRPQQHIISRPMTKNQNQRLLIIDFGSQVTQLIARRLRELNVYCEIHPFQNVTDQFLINFAPKAVIFSGGPASVIDVESPRPPQSVFALGVPILGICYGQQVIMQMLGGQRRAWTWHRRVWTRHRSHKRLAI